MAEQLDTEQKPSSLRAHRLMSGLEFDEKSYQFDDQFKSADVSDPWSVHTSAEMIACLEKNPKVELDARVIGVQGKKIAVKALERDQFISAFKSDKFKFKEASDSFALDPSETSVNAGSIGDDFMPMLGGPFYKNLYFYQDYIRMHAASFHAFHHDPIAKAVVAITRDFTLGRGYRVDCDDEAALALWRMVEQANDLEGLMYDFATELSIYGEHIIWKLPRGESRITFKLNDGDKPPQGILPRYRLVDPSNIIEIVTYPEDISRKLFYVWLAPTQYQIYTGMGGSGEGSAPIQPVMKFIYRQIPAEQMLHYRTNAVSNEKRGRSDFYGALGYMKMLRDSVKYSMIALQKQAAWGIDTTIEGSQSDVDGYVDSQRQTGTIAPAGSEFVHTSKIKREFLSNQAGRAGTQSAFEWCLSMISAYTQIPMNYLGTHLSGGQTRASAIVATEPVAKKFEMRQQIYRRVIKMIWDDVMQWAGLGSVDCEITFPEIITQDRSAKLKDLALAETQGWIKKERAAEIAVKELGIMDYDYSEENKEMPATTPAASANPLTSPGAVGSTQKTNGAIPGQERKDIKQNYAS